jgi:hypothetical protein
MGRFLVLSRVIGGAIHLHQYEPRRVIGLLNNVEAGHARLLNAAASVCYRSRPKRLNLVRLNMHKNMNYKHSLAPKYNTFERLKRKFTAQLASRQMILNSTVPSSPPAFVIPDFFQLISWNRDFDTRRTV